MDNQKSLSPKLLVVVVERGKANSYIEYLKGFGLTSDFVCYGEGTVSNEIADMLGLADIDKEIICSVLSNESSKLILEKLEKKFASQVNEGVAFTIKLSSIANKMLLNSLQGEKE